MFSMTGYGRGEAEQNGRTLVVELKSVNHRFLDLSIKLPRALLFAEDAMKKLISSRVSRGHIDVFTTYSAPKDQGVLTLNKSVAENYVEMGKELSASFGLKNDLTASSLLRVQGVVEEGVPTVSEEEVIALVTEATNRALDSLLKMRDTEGKAITADILTKLSEIERLTGVIETRAPFVSAEYKTPWRRPCAKRFRAPITTRHACLQKSPCSPTSAPLMRNSLVCTLTSTTIARSCPPNPRRDASLTS